MIPPKRSLSEDGKSSDNGSTVRSRILRENNVSDIMMPSVQVMTAGGAGNTSQQSPSRPKEQQNRSDDEKENGGMGLDLIDLATTPADRSASNPHIPVSTSLEMKTESLQPQEESIDAFYHRKSSQAVEVPSSEKHFEEESWRRHLWLFICFLGIMISFVCYGLLLEYATSGGRKLHELSFLFVTSTLYTMTAAAGRHVRDEVPTSIPPARFAVLGILSMGSTFFSVRSLRYVIYPIQVLAKSCKPVPVMLMGALMGKTYPLKKYINVVMIVFGVALFMGGGSGSKKKELDEEKTSYGQIIGVLLLFVSLCFDGGTGAYEDKLMAVHHVGPFDLMYNIQLGKTILAGVALLVLNQVHIFVQMCQEMGFLLVALGLSGAMGQVFIFVTISKFGALTCSIIGLARKVTTLVASIIFYGHSLSGIQFIGLVTCVTAMVMNFWGKKSGGGHGHPAPPPPPQHTESTTAEELKTLVPYEEEDDEEDDDEDLELANPSPPSSSKPTGS